MRKERLKTILLIGSSRISTCLNINRIVDEAELLLETEKLNGIEFKTVDVDNLKKTLDDTNCNSNVLIDSFLRLELPYPIPDFIPSNSLCPKAYGQLNHRERRQKQKFNNHSYGSKKFNPKR